jgi:serine/threonine-protein kinase RsbT
MPDEYVIPIEHDEDIVAARSKARDIARRLGFGMVDQSRIATAVSELARNAVRYANQSHASATIRELSPVAGKVGIEIVVVDHGPGIPDLQIAMQEGFTSGGGMGLGLSGTQRLMDDFTIESKPGSGTTVIVRKWRR